jgi:two-component system, cell cycle response regulator DivK
MALILIIEDNPTSHALLVELMQAAGHPALRVSSEREALLLGPYETPDLILHDITLLEMNGYELMRQLRSGVGLRCVPVVAVTALAMDRDLKSFLAVGLDGYFSKPVVPPTFAREVEAFLQQSRT